ncbi:hypothetical protein GVO57_02355 [Sphingomonas changnyeongensis]|uniref:VOC domain-containing protein n=1 Tax=Sphingomonas changnyeongensis TaxID=2698679 RepID=A0A7Z2NUV6_9SPHN|nr:VOC family protein [Sphingomonas changnyeongensis]QHL89876.1 hypothetical protein GVO57_02355 [Sphingomonas changnyeongensis]
MTAYLEHVQYVAPDLDALIGFYTRLFDWRLRGRGHERAADRSYDWVHIGDDQSYLAFRSPYDGADYGPDLALRQTHIGVVVLDLAAVIDRARAEGAQVTLKPPHPSRLRAYLRDPAGHEIELVQYLTADPRARHAYDD